MVLDNLFMDATGLCNVQCRGCHQDVSQESPGIIICPDCLIERYCSASCARNCREEHEAMCEQLALQKLHMVLNATIGKRYGAAAQGAAGQLLGWMEAVNQSVTDKGVLPDCCTEEQLNALSVLWPRACAIQQSDPSIAYRMLILAIRYALTVPRPAARVQRLFHDSHALIEAIPPASEEEGAKMWGCEHVFTLCVSVAELLANVGRPREAVDFIQSVKPNLEVALLMKTGTQEDRDTHLYRLVGLYKSHARWVKQCIPGMLMRAEYRAHPDRQRRIEWLKQAIKLGKGSTEMVAGCAYELGREHLYVEDIDLALQVFQKSLKLPWNKRSAEIALKAVESHIMAGRDIQAGKWIDQLLRLEEHCPGRLTALDEYLLYSLRALLCRRRGQHREALNLYDKAQRRLMHFKATMHPDLRELADSMIDLTMDKADCLDALGRRDAKVAQVLKQFSAQEGIRRPLEQLGFMQGLLDKGQAAEALAMFEAFTEQMVKEAGVHYWLWRLKGVTLWGMEMLSKWEGLVMQLLPEGGRRAAVLARIEEMRGLEETMKQKLLDDRRAQAIVEVREQVTGKPAAEGEGILEITGEATADGEGMLALTGEATEDRKPSKAARKKRKKRQKKAAQAQHDSTQQGAEAGLEQSMAGLGINQEGEASEGEGQMDAGGKQLAVVAEKEECAICLNELGGEEGEEGLVCGHVLHSSCLRCWASKCVSLSIETTCPVCRRPLVEESSN